MVNTRGNPPTVSSKKPARPVGETLSDSIGSPSESLSVGDQPELDAKMDIETIVEAIIQAFTDKRLVENRLAPALGPAIAPALHDCFMLELEKRDEKIKRLESKLSNVEARVEELEQYSRRNCLVIHGIKENPQENTDELVCELAKDHLEVEIQPHDIDRSHRIGEKGRLDRKGNALPRPIIAKFATYGPRSRFYAARSKLKSTRIFIHENLTIERQKLLRNVRSKYPPPNNKIWTQDGKIKIRTTNNLFTIASHDDWSEHCKRT